MPNRPRKFEPPNSSFRGKTPSMKVSKGFNDDPLRPKKHYVTVEAEPGKWMIVGNSAEPLEMLRLAVARDHAIGMQGDNMMIVGEDQVVEDSFHNYIPVPQQEGEEIGEENAQIRNRWISSILKFVLPRELHDFIFDDAHREEIQSELLAKQMAMSLRPDGRAVIIFREDKPLASWAC